MKKDSYTCVDALDEISRIYIDIITDPTIDNDEKIAFMKTVRELPELFGDYILKSTQN